MNYERIIEKSRSVTHRGYVNKMMRHINIIAYIAVWSLITVVLSPHMACAEEINNDIDYLDAYGPLIDIISEYYESSYYYSLCDLDDDGIYEIILQYGSSTADYSNEVYAISGDDEIPYSYIGSFAAQQSFYVAPDYKGIYAVYGHMGYETVTRITVEHGELFEEVVSERDYVDVEDYYSNDMPISVYNVNDSSGLMESAISVLDDYISLKETDNSYEELEVATVFKDGISDDYIYTSYMVDPDKIMEDYYEKGFTYVWLKSHEGAESENDSDHVYLQATHEDPNSMYYAIYDIEAWYTKISGTYEIFMDTAETSLLCDLSGFNGTCWKLTNSAWYTMYDFVDDFSGYFEGLESISTEADGVEHSYDVYFYFDDLGKYYAEIDDDLYSLRNDYSTIELRMSNSFGTMIILLDGTVYEIPIEASQTRSTIQYSKDLLTIYLTYNSNDLTILYYYPDVENIEYRMSSPGYIMEITREELADVTGLSDWSIDEYSLSMFNPDGIDFVEVP